MGFAEDGAFVVTTHEGNWVYKKNVKVDENTLRTIANLLNMPDYVKATIPDAKSIQVFVGRKKPGP